MKVSVVIPSYNHCDYVVQAIDSVMAQTYKDIELTVIDDGSTDGSQELILACQKRHNNKFTFVGKENSGLVATLEQGLNMAKGEFFCQLASDDYLHPDSVAKRVEFLKQNSEVVVVYTDAYKIDGEINTGVGITSEKMRSLYKSDDPIYCMVNNCFPVFATGLMRTKALKVAGGFDSARYRYFEDLDTAVRLCLQGKMGYIDEKLFYRRIHATNVSGTTTHIRREKVRFYDKMLSHPGMEKYRKPVDYMKKRSVLQLSRILKRQEQVVMEDYDTLKEHCRSYFYDLRIRWNVFVVDRKIKTKNKYG